MRIAAIDQGTTSTRCLVLEEDGSFHVVHSRTHRQIYPRQGWVEHDPLELLANVQACIDAAGPVDALGIDNQGESCLAWDGQTGAPVSAVIVWQDRRTQAAISRLQADGAQELTLRLAGLPLDPYFSAAKFAWMVENIPEAKALLAQGRLRLGTTDAFFIERLSGHFCTDITTASRTSLMNLRTGQWDEQLCALFGVPMEALPEIRPSAGDFGIARTENTSVPLRAGIVDQQASLHGHGCRKAGDAKITFGTGAFALAVSGETPLMAPRQGLLPTIAWQKGANPPVYALDGGVYSAASALNWARSLGLFDSFDEINSFDAEPAISRGLAFVPAFSGLGCPYWDGSAAGLWIGMSLDTTPADMVQSILEGIALRAAQVIAAMGACVDIRDTISIDGGVSANPYFCQFLADVLQKGVIVHETAEQTALGTALMAAEGAGLEVPGGAQDKARTFEPAKTPASFMHTYEEAIARSRNWRSHEQGS